LLLTAVVYIAVGSLDPPLWLGALAIGLLAGVGHRLMYEIMRRRRMRDEPRSPGGQPNARHQNQ
jgi:hypothetical protein